MTTGGPGSCVDPAVRLRGALRGELWATLILQKDNLNLNDNIVCFEQERLAAVKLGDGANGMTVLDLNCVGHSCILSLKPLIKWVGIDTHLVRLGHSLSSSRIWGLYLDNISKVVKRNFRYKEVVELPEGAAQWRRRLLVREGF